MVLISEKDEGGRGRKRERMREKGMEYIRMRKLEKVFYAIHHEM